MTASPPPVTVTVTVAVPDTSGFAVETAVTVRLPAVSPAATVRVAGLSPDPNLVSALVFPLTLQVTVWAGLLVPVTVALNCWVPPFATSAAAGLTVTPVTTGSSPPPDVTVTSAVPDLVLSAPEAAVTVRVAAVSSAATVRVAFKPVPLMAVSGLLCPLTLQVTAAL